MFASNTIVPWVVGVLCAVVVTLIIHAGMKYPGSVTVFAIFNIAYLALIGLIVPRPRSYAYTFFAAFLSLGFWMKTVVLTIWAAGFAEPVGAFKGGPEEWDDGLALASWGAAGVVSARFAHILLRKRAAAQVDKVRAYSSPPWFQRWRGQIWLGTIILIVGTNVANLHFGFFQVGVNPRLILPAHLNVVVAWLVNIGFALWLATLLLWDSRIDERSLARNLRVPILEAFLSSVSTMSRQVFLLHLVPYVLAIAENWRELRTSMNRSILLVLGWGFAILVVISLLAVFLLRLIHHDELARYVVPEDTLVRHYTRTLVGDLPKLFVHRWVGLEGVLAVGAAPGRGPDLLLAALLENPKRGGDSLYQRVARTHYLSDDPQKYTYLSNAGITAIFAFSGTAIVVLLGMAFVTAVLILTEHVAQRLTGNPFLLAVGGAGLANVLAQTTFPYLTLIYVLQLWVAVAFIAVLEHSRLRAGGSC